MSVEIGSKSAKSEPNVVPLCDILLVLLIIFMVVTPMITHGANVTLPEAKYVASQPDPAQILTVEIEKSGKVMFDGKEITNLETLGQMIIDKLEDLQRPDKKVLLKADLQAVYGRVVDVLSAIKEAQIEVIGLVTEQKASSME
ncbi:MAG: biopolymer transporter ExbD, partial [Candidatus Aminicenantes bacterium]|nr:biopolymer transporter ExbD [Candidatus Aminicenantes bacterium]